MQFLAGCLLCLGGLLLQSAIGLADPLPQVAEASNMRSSGTAT